MNHVTYPLSSADISIFLPKISKCYYIKKYRYRFHLDRQFLILLTFLETLRIVLINMVAILMMSAKIATAALLKIKFFRKKAMTSNFLSMTSPKKILLRDSNYNINMVMWPKFGNSIISVRKVIITSIL